MTLDNSLLKKIEDFKSFIANMIPIAGNNTPNADTTNGNVGNGTTWARSDHSHPKSSLYAEASHVHNEYLTSQDIVNKVDKVTGKDLSTNDFTDSYKDKLDLNFGYVDHNLKLHFVEVDEATLSSSPNVAMNGDITNIMAHITDSENNNVIDAPIDFYQDNVYYDTGITNNNGLASIEYFGNGIGQTNFTVKCGSFQSEPYTLWDTLFYDGGTSDNYNSNWTNRNNLLNVDRTTHNYTLLSETGSQYAQYIASGTYSQDIVIEFDYYYQGYGPSYVGMGGTMFNLLGYAPEDCHVKITVEGNLMTFYKDNVANATTKTKSSSDNTVAFQINDGGADIGYKNFKIYLL